MGEGWENDGKGMGEGRERDGEGMGAQRGRANSVRNIRYGDNVLPFSGAENRKVCTNVCIRGIYNNYMQADVRPHLTFPYVANITFPLFPTKFEYVCFTLICLSNINNQNDTSINTQENTDCLL